MDKYDIVFGVSTYHSSRLAIQLLRSVSMIHANVLFIISGNRKEDIDEIKSANITTCDHILFVSDINNSWYNQNWAFIYCVNNGIEANFFCNIDDDIEFTQNSTRLINELVFFWFKYNFALMTFSTPHNYYGMDASSIVDGVSLNIPWFNGDSIFTKWETALNHGLPDTTLDSHMSYFAEMEYAHRMRYLTGHKIVTHCAPNFYLHHMRTDPVIAKLRADRSMDAIHSGMDVWRKKYNANADGVITRGSAYEVLYNEVMKPENENAIKWSLCYDEKWSDWDKIYDNIRDKFRIHSWVLK
jgi:hypothetical protein